MSLPAPINYHETLEIPNYTVVEQLYIGSRTAVYRAVQTDQGLPVVIKVLRKEYPSFSELVQFRNQYTTTKNLPIPGIIPPLSLKPLGNSYALVMADWGGIALSKYTQQQTLHWSEVLIIASQLTDILHDLSQHQVVHKDIKPANILIHPESKQVKLIDFSIASLLPKEIQENQSPSSLEGTLAYIAPEQTGRMNRGIDYRSDFYALGVTLYQLLTGTLPFVCDDPLELLHCHIAKTAVPIHQVNPDVPTQVSAIAAKLMAKNAEDRYQSAMGLKHDLEQCLTDCKDNSIISRFELGQRDLSDRFNIPEKLYGREREVQTLLESFERVADGASELMLVAGFSGIGKTAVVNEVHKPIVRQRGYFIRGKYDQFNRNIPLSAFVQALRDLMSQLLSESDAQLESWKNLILAAVESNGQVLIEVIPELEQIIGKQPPVPELSGSAAQNRFNLLFPKFIEVFSTSEHPLVMFLDDLQWADAASLQLIKLLMNDHGYLLILGAYRDHEVSAAHPFILTVDELNKAGMTVHTITLSALDFADVNHLIADTLSCPVELAKPLTELVMQKTQGNPFFLTQFLKALHEEKLITFNYEQRYWECDITQVRARSLTDDVVEFMARQLQKLPTETQQVLKLAACVGNQFDLNTLAIVSQQSATDAATVLWKALQEGLVLPTSQIYKLFQATTESSQTNNTANPRYRFLHDRVQQAAYLLIPVAQRQNTHLQIGQLLLKNTPTDAVATNIFEIVNHFNQGISLLQTTQQKTELSRLNLLAGRKAKAAAAYESASNYLNIGLNILSEESWNDEYDLTLDLHVEATEVCFLCTDFERSRQLADVTLRYAKTLLDQVRVHEVELLYYAAQNQALSVINLTLQVLEALGIALEDQAPQDLVIEDLSHLREMTDPGKLGAMRLLINTYAPAMMAAPDVLPKLLFTAIKLCLEAGNSAMAAVSYAFYGSLLVNLGDINAGYQFGELAIKILNQFDSRPHYCVVHTVFNILLRHWQESIRETIEPCRNAMKVGLETGDLYFVGCLSKDSCTNLFLMGENLEVVNQQQTYSLELLQKLKQQFSIYYAGIWHQLVLNLRGLAEKQNCLIGDGFDEFELLPKLQADNDQILLFNLYLAKGILLYFWADYENSVICHSCAREYMSAVSAMATLPTHNFYESLALLAQYPCSSSEQSSSLEQIVANQEKMKYWANYAPQNFQHKYDLVAAEEYCVLSQPYQAMEYYDRAIAGANINGYIHEEALANELAAKFYLNWGKEKVAQHYLINAYYGYARWGAKAKVQDLEQQYPALLASILQQQKMTVSATETLFATESLAASQFTYAESSTSASSSTISSTLDLATVLKASQALSSEIQLDQLLATLLEMVIKSAGADKGILLMPRQQDWFVEAVAMLNQPVQVQAIALTDSTNLPHSLINTVKRNLQPVVITDASTHLNLATDSYIAQQQTKSVLCTPILLQNKLIAILYLENRVTAAAFTRDRVELLNVLCTQAAISLENARLYADAQEKLRLLTLRSSIDSILTQNKTLATLLQQCTEAIVEHLGVAFARIWTLNESEQVLELRASAGLYTHINGPHSVVPVGKFKIGLIAQERLPHLTNDVLIDPRVGDKIWAKREGMIAFAGYPLLLDDRLVGVLAMFARQRLDSSVLDTLGFVAGEIAVGIERQQMAETLEISEAELKLKAQALEESLQNLKQAQLQTVQSEKMASLGNLVAGVAHEVNNPIGFLNGSINNVKDYVKDLLQHLELYQQHCPPATPIQDNAKDIDLEFLCQDLPKILDSMKAATDRIKNISTSLRTFSRADTEYKVSANLHEGLDSTLLILKYRLKASELRPAIAVIQDYGELPMIECFPGQLNQVFMNILANAIDVFDEMAQTQSLEQFPANPQTITIQTKQIDNQVLICIRDNGTGMSEEVQAKIFDHLFTTKSVGKGTGLGLAIARQIVVEKHGGSIKVQSALGQGTEFAIFLPIRG
ncbi:ATP-binding sensor histidine kinase [Nostoc sp. TCL26-01]|uniref:trifunctional serine/threonine-protein kinase/ATP-binding protein/sensor histidine kinase n=1 Tax=Nostoc sp. TCL26-01 TaxID=2576904 RepID=UPI0015B8BE92|nr:ATP-binding sensor histidine kinase [Nostoc sp. TCL26-01]QLE59508.1 GAF domain-containing protein [Nostoc sp. TCL26-01]